MAVASRGARWKALLTEKGLLRNGKISAKGYDGRSGFLTMARGGLNFGIFLEDVVAVTDDFIVVRTKNPNDPPEMWYLWDDVAGLQILKAP